VSLMTLSTSKDINADIAYLLRPPRRPKANYQAKEANAQKTRERPVSAGVVVDLPRCSEDSVLWVRHGAGFIALRPPSSARAHADM
jgi:hypothetical protein